MDEDVRIPRRSHGELCAVLYKTGSSGCALAILCHGFSGGKHEGGRFVELARALNSRGWDALAFDFSGSGENEREPLLLSTEIENLEDAYSWALAQGYRDISTIGLSFGGLVSLSADLPGRRAAVFWAPAMRMTKVLHKRREILVRIYEFFRRKPFPKKPAAGGAVLLTGRLFREARTHDVDSRLARFEIPSLTLHGTADEVIRLEWAREAFSRMPQDGRHSFSEVQGARHGFTGDHLAEFIRRTLDWLR